MRLTFAFGRPDNPIFFHISFMLGALDLKVQEPLGSLINLNCVVIENIHTPPMEGSLV